MQAGRYRYVKYDRRNGPIKVGEPMFVNDLDTFEVAKRGTFPIGVSLISMRWRWWERLMWFVTGRKKLGRWSPIRFFFICESGFIGM